jgi:hypothetical protein
MTWFRGEQAEETEWNVFHDLKLGFEYTILRALEHSLERPAWNEKLRFMEILRRRTEVQ